MKSSEFITEEIRQLEENLRDWFKEKWVRFGPDGKIRGDCARGSESEGKPKCLPQAKAHALGKKGRASAAARKRREDPDADRRGAAINVATKKKVKESPESCPHCGGPLYEYGSLMEKKDACYYKVKASAKVWPSAYASGRLVQCRKKGASNYGNKSESAVTESNTLSPGAVRKLQHMLNTKFNANLDVDGVLGDLTQKSINRYLPAARAGSAPDPDRTTAVQGLAAKHQKHKVNK
jgi:hypothetical protein